MKIVETDNYDGDYPDEKFLDLPDLSCASAGLIVNMINEAAGKTHPRHWKVVENDYILCPGFEP